MPASSLPPSLPTQPLSVTSSSSYNDLTQTFGQLGISPQYGSIQSVGLPQQSSIANAFGPTQTLHTQFSGSIGQPVMTQPHMPYSSMPPQFFQQTFRGFARGRGRVGYKGVFPSHFVINGNRTQELGNSRTRLFLSLNLSSIFISEMDSGFLQLVGDFTSNLKLLQHYPSTNISHLLYVANKLRTQPAR
ncbi:hypothetical protein RHGRI_003868 [Rhododendron griersonianum]|uniref:Uncharacterized protein n=1 Tax=Rhododendron griersonianum TaxID=479676 RepID=A0AAV6L6I7_9ERIC|nr:hypothetical protein RHGRI_003868 [Rhododendron griersonianum]